jgi:hypothetical protein
MDSQAPIRCRKTSRPAGESGRISNTVSGSAVAEEESV